MPRSAYYDYYAVIESALDGDTIARRYSIDDEPVKRPDGSLSFLRFTACLMRVNCRNRNKRYWGKDHIDAMMRAPHILDYFTKAGGMPGENGHPVPMSGEISMDRLVTIDPNNMAILVKKWWWDGDFMMGNVETLDQGDGTPGNRMMMNMIQGMVPAFSVRTLVPQRYNADGTIDVTGPGRFVCPDRVNGPSCPDAYMDINIPVKNIITKSEFDLAMESFGAYALERSEAAKHVLNDLVPAMESLKVDTRGSLYAEGINPHSGEVEKRIIPLERSFRSDIRDFMRKF